MTLKNLAGMAVLALALTGCDSMPAIPSWVPFIGQKEASPPAAPPGTPAANPPADSAPPAPAPEPAPPPPRVVTEDEPWTPIDTGTVAPGMTREQVIALWGVPVSERAQGEWVYLYFRNGCEYSCGMFDLVLLQNGAVVDAVVRGPGHNYAGESSSPPGKLPQATPRGGVLTVPPTGGAA